MDPPDGFEAVIYTRWPCPNTKRVGRGLSLCRERASIVTRADFYQRVDNLPREKTSCAACSRWKKKEEKIQHFPPIFPQRRYEDTFGFSLKAMPLKKK